MTLRVDQAFIDSVRIGVDELDRGLGKDISELYADTGLDTPYKSRPENAGVNMDALHDEWLAAQSSVEMREALIDDLYSELAPPYDDSGYDDEWFDAFEEMISGLSAGAVAALCESNDVQGYESFDDWLVYRMSDEYEEDV